MFMKKEARQKLIILDKRMVSPGIALIFILILLVLNNIFFIGLSPELEDDTNKSADEEETIEISKKRMEAIKTVVTEIIGELKEEQRLRKIHFYINIGLGVVLIILVVIIIIKRLRRKNKISFIT